jgi:hypothetical protein
MKPAKTEDGQISSSYGPLSATRELTGRSKTRNGDDRPSGPVSWRLERRVPQEPGSGDEKTVANSGQIGRLVEARCYLPLNNG